MTKELQDLVWSILPKEFKEEVKKMWQSADKERQLPHDAFLRGEYSILVSLFGLHNLTSDAEGEEMLTVKAKTVRDMYAYNAAVLSLDPTHKGAILLRKKLQKLFGSKCLPDEIADRALKPIEEHFTKTAAHEDNFTSKSPKPTKPKFRIGDKVKDISSPHDGGIYKVDDIKKSPDGFIYHIQGLIGKSNVKESDLEPYTEPTEDVDFNVPEPNCKYFKDGKCAHPAVSHIENGKLVKGADCDVSSCEDVKYEPKPAEMTEERYQYLNSLTIEDYDNETSAEEQRKFCEYQRKYHPNEVLWVQTHSDDKELKPAEPKFKVGDIVRIKSNAAEYHKGYQNGYAWLPDRDMFVGKTTYITAFKPSGSIELKISGENYGWSEIDLEPYTSQDPIPPNSGELKPQNAETQSSPQFNIGDKVKIIGGYYGFIGHIGEVISTNGNDINVNLPGYGISTYDAEDLAPYAADDLMPPTWTNESPSPCPSPDQFPDPTKMVDGIISRDFESHNRLHIAAMAMAGLLANEGVSCFTDVQEHEHMDFITYHAFEYADKLIKKSKEDG